MILADIYETIHYKTIYHVETLHEYIGSYSDLEIPVEVLRQPVLFIRACNHDEMTIVLDTIINPLEGERTKMTFNQLYPFTDSATIYIFENAMEEEIGIYTDSTFPIILFSQPIRFITAVEHGKLRITLDTYLNPLESITEVNNNENP